MTKTHISISNIYNNVSVFHPSYWFSSRSSVSLIQLTGYFVFLVLLLLMCSALIYFESKNKTNPFKKRFYKARFWWLLLFLLIAALLTFFRFQGIATLSARALWLPYVLALSYFAYFSLVEFTKKIPEKTSKHEASLLKNRYLRAFKKKR